MADARAIGFVEPASGRQSDFAMQSHPQVVATIGAWAESIGYDAAIWTALASNFDEWGKGGEPFSVSAALQYLETLEREDPRQVRAGARLHSQRAARGRDAGARARSPSAGLCNRLWTMRACSRYTATRTRFGRISHDESLWPFPRRLRDQAQYAAPIEA